MTENQKFESGDRVCWRYGGATHVGTVQEPVMKGLDIERREKLAIGGYMLVKPDTGVRAGWISTEQLRSFDPANHRNQSRR